MNYIKPYLVLFFFIILGCGEKPKDLNYAGTTNNTGEGQNTRNVTLYDEANSSANYEANQHLIAGEYLEAEKIYREIISVSPKEHVAYHGLGTALYFQERYTDAKKMYLKAIELNPKFSISYSALGAIESTLGNLELALEHYNKAIKIEPNNVEGYNGRAKVYKKLGKLELAITDLEKVIELAPDSELSSQAQKRIEKLNRRLNKI